jgi:Carboxypeptidase regulatory-like domain
MVSSARPAIACLLILLIFAILTQAQSATEKIPGATITGKVTLKGNGASGITVGLVAIDQQSSQRPTRYTGSTDESGVYRITNVTPGSYRVVVEAPAFISENNSNDFQTLLINPGETVENIDFALLRGGVITGRVTDSEGRPVVEERVSLLPIGSNERSSYSMLLPVQTDDRGIYRSFGIPPGTYKVVVGTNEEGLFSQRWGRVAYRRTFHPATTDAAQAIRIEVNEGSEIANVDITVGRAIANYSARGRIVDGETGQPLANVPYGVTVFIGHNSSSSLTTGAVSTSSGEFKFENLSPGQYAVFLESSSESDSRAEPVRFEVNDRDVSGLLVKTSKGGSISGVVVLEGTDDKTLFAKLSQARVYVDVSSETSSPNSNRSSTIKPDGSFRLGGLRSGLAQLGLAMEDFQLVRVERNGVAQPTGLEINQQEHITGVRLIVNYGNGTIRGIVKVPAGALPADAHFNVWLKRIAETPQVSNANFARPLMLDVRGQFFANGLIPGTYEVTGLYAPIDSDGKILGAKQQVVVSNGAVTNITLTLQPQADSDRP